VYTQRTCIKSKVGFLEVSSDSTCWGSCDNQSMHSGIQIPGKISSR
jgi:hypothetical protein